jgi:hypothetical protein
VQCILNERQRLRHSQVWFDESIANESARRVAALKELGIHIPLSHSYGWTSTRIGHCLQRCVWRMFLFWLTYRSAECECAFAQGWNRAERRAIEEEGPRRSEW